MDYKKVIGDGEELSELLQDMVGEEIISLERGFEIKKELKSAYENGEIKDNGLSARLDYLIEGNDLSKDRKLFIKNLKNNHLNLCPHCYQPIELSDKFCKTCGHNTSDGKTLNYDKVLDGMSSDGNILNETDDEIVLDLRGDRLDKFLDEMNDDDSVDDFNEIFLIRKKLYGIYKNEDIETFNELKDEIYLDIDEFSEFGLLDIGSYIDLSEFFGENVSYIKNYYKPLLLKDFVDIKKHHLGSVPENTKLFSHEFYYLLSALKNNVNIDEIIKVADLGFDTIIMLFNLGAIESKKYGNDFLDILMNYKVSDLKKILKANNLKVSGNKMELIVRICENGLFSEFGENEFIVTDAGEQILSGLDWVSTFDWALDLFDIVDFQLFCNDKAGFKINVFNYLNGFSKKAGNDFHLLFDVLSAKAFLYVAENDFKRALAEELKLFMLKLNPIYLTGEDLSSYDAFSYENCNNINILAALSGVSNFKKIFNKNWGLMDFEKTLVPKKIALKYLNRVSSGANLDDLSREVADKYYK